MGRRSRLWELALVIVLTGLTAYWMSSRTQSVPAPPRPPTAEPVVTATPLVMTATPEASNEVPTVTATPVLSPPPPPYKPYSPPPRPPGKYEEGGDSLYTH